VTEIYAHRGLHVNERENTVPSFLAARALGVDGVELDLRRTLDGALVVHHDPLIGDLVISRTRQRDLPDYVPTFDEAMTACAGLRVNVEIKNLQHASEPTYDPSGDFARQVVTHVHQIGWADAVIISSFDQATCAVVRSFDPTIAVGWLLHWELDLANAMTQARVLGLSAVHPHFMVLDAGGVARARELDLDVNVWTVSEPGDIEAMAALGVNSIITDDPATALALTERSSIEAPRE
jgi:glycerophosphoryl diester phosphodiesterase